MTIALIILSLSLPLISIFAFYKGFKLGQMKVLMEQIETNNKKVNLFKRDKPIPETEEERKQRTLDENIEKYDGTGKGQVRL